jgi:hypothetical protein
MLKQIFKSDISIFADASADTTNNRADINTYTSNGRDHLFILSKLMWYLKSLLDQNSIVIHSKSTDNFKNNINLRE